MEWGNHIEQKNQRENSFQLNVWVLAEIKIESSTPLKRMYF